MKRITIIGTVCFAIFAGFLSCKGMVYENHTACDAYVLFDVLNSRYFNDSEVISVGTRLINDGSELPFEQTSIGDIRSRRYFHSVEGNSSWNGFGILGYDGLIRTGYRLVSSLGDDFSPLYIFDFRLTDVVGTITAPVVFHKEHSFVKVVFTGWERTVGGLSPFKIQVVGTTCGIELLNKVPVFGEFDICPKEINAGVFQFIIPRLGDENLMLKVSLKEGVDEISVFPREIDLWSYMKVLGNVNWNLDDLPDIELYVDVTGPVYNIRLYEWDGGNT